MTAGTLRARGGYTEASVLQAMLERLGGEFAFMILANPMERCFRRFDQAEASDVGRWTTGHLFGASAELRWRRHRQGYAVCVTADKDVDASDLTEAEDPEPLTCESVLVRLWGERVADDPSVPENVVWTDGQVPATLVYPFDETLPAKVGLRLNRYCRADGSVAFVRFVGLEDWTHA